MTDMLDTRYVLSQNVVIEDFDNEALIFMPRKRHLIKINSITRSILNKLDGQCTIRDIAHELVSAYDISFDLLFKDIKVILTDLTKQRIIKDKNKLMQIKDFEHMENKKYSINHDISCRVEEPEGAVLFNPETDAVKAINPIGLAIWQVLEYPLDKREIIEHLLDICEGVPKESVAQDVDEFIDKLITDGFIGEVVK